MNYLSAKYHSSWTPFFEEHQPLLSTIDQKLSASSATIYPPRELIFNAFSHTPLPNVKVVILGQDPYHGEGEAHGLAFSVEQGVKMPPSLRNIFKELTSDVGVTRISTNLQDWAQQGVLLINATLTVEQDAAGSHQKIGWETFTDTLIAYLAQQKQPIVFILWGAYARKKAPLIVGPTNCIIEGVHPSPLSAYRGFFGSRPFSRTNTYLIEQGITPIVWGENQ